MLGFYSVRKLLEGKKLTHDLTNKHFTLPTYPWTGISVTLLNRDKVNKLYDFDRHGHREFSLWALCGIVVHSYVFVPVLDETRSLDSFLLELGSYKAQRGVYDSRRHGD